MKALLIADSGGTCTDWCAIDTNGGRTFFQGRSLHPLYVAEEPSEEDQLFWTEKAHLRGYELHFFGAGCLHSDVAEKLRTYFKKLGFPSVKVASDLHAAAFALLPNGTGNLAIMGTGSVAASFRDYQLTELVGGLGYLLGDEGSGFYFGKLLIGAYLNKELESALDLKMKGLVGERGEVLNKVYSAEGRSFLSGLSKSVSGFLNPQILKLQEKNIDLFLELTIPKLTATNGTVYFTGSYAWHNRRLIEDLLKKRGQICGDIVDRPIGKLSEYFLRTAF
jgi:glucosamine kinase